MVSPWSQSCFPRDLQMHCIQQELKMVMKTRQHQKLHRTLLPQGRRGWQDHWSDCNWGASCPGFSISQAKTMGVNDCSNVRDGNTDWKTIHSSTASVYTKGKGDAGEICSKVTQQDRDRAGTGTHGSWVTISIHPVTTVHSLPMSVFLHAETCPFVK